MGQISDPLRCFLRRISRFPDEIALGFGRFLELTVPGLPSPPPDGSTGRLIGLELRLYGEQARHSLSSTVRCRSFRLGLTMPVPAALSRPRTCSAKQPHTALGGELRRPPASSRMRVETAA